MQNRDTIHKLKLEADKLPLSIIEKYLSDKALERLGEALNHGNISSFRTLLIEETHNFITLATKPTEAYKGTNKGFKLF